MIGILEYLQVSHSFVSAFVYVYLCISAFVKSWELSSWRLAEKTETWVEIFQKKTVSGKEFVLGGSDYEYDGCTDLQIIAERQEDQNIDGHSWADRRRGEKHFWPKWTVDFMHDFLKQSIDFLLINCLHEQVNAATMEQSSEMLNSILKWNHSNKIRKLTNKNKVRQWQEEACESKKEHK